MQVPVAEYDSYEFTMASDGIRLILRDNGSVFYSVLVSQHSSQESGADGSESTFLNENDHVSTVDLSTLFEITPDNLQFEETTLRADSQVLGALTRKTFAEPAGYPDPSLRIVKLHGEGLTGYAVHGPGPKPDTYGWMAELSDQDNDVLWFFRHKAGNAVGFDIESNLKVLAPSAHSAPPWWPGLEQRIRAAEPRAPDRPYTGALMPP